MVYRVLGWGFVTFEWAGFVTRWRALEALALADGAGVPPMAVESGACPHCRGCEGIETPLGRLLPQLANGDLALCGFDLCREVGGRRHLDRLRSLRRTKKSEKGRASRVRNVRVNRFSSRVGCDRALLAL